MPRPKSPRDPLEPWPGPIMCPSCGYRNQVRGEWRGNVFYPASTKCLGCEEKERAAGKEQG